MDEINVMDSVPHRLILSGLKELDRHGVTDFSLRRVALDAGVSCAAPYRHYADKEQLISAIVTYVLDGWLLLADEINSAFADDLARCITELCVSGYRFFIGNGNFRTVLLSSVSSGASDATDRFTAPICTAAERYAAEQGSHDPSAFAFSVCSVLLGSILMSHNLSDHAEATASLLRTSIELLMNTQ